MTGGLIAITCAATYIYYILIGVRDKSIRDKVTTRLFVSFVLESKPELKTERYAEAFIHKLNVSEWKALRSEIKEWPEWKKEVQRCEHAELYPHRKRLSVIILTLSVVVAVVVLVVFPDIRREDFSPVYWPLLMFTFIPPFIAGMAMDVADRIWRRSSRAKSSVGHG
ncbi:hypothetical protein AB0B28_09200 [Glycomyces sp. NPDC046736]|uniref:hypothetical protein n=1 Tax=Glycomyces sp. NPDC046736 TaxID=3155615 RepID=UPI0033FBD1B0